MNLLLDTCVVLWLMMQPKRLSPRLLEILSNPDNKRALSVASVWEIAVKWRSGKLQLPKPPMEMIPEIREKGKMRPLALDEATALQILRLPNLHSDPFDRMLICQAIEHSLTIVTPDDQIRRYPVKTLWM